MAVEVGLIGMHVRVIESSNPSLVGVDGKIIDETRNMVTLENSKRIKLIKNHVKLEIKWKKKKE